MKALYSVVILTLLLAGCSAQSPAPEKQVQSDLDKSINCTTAYTDIQTLTKEKARTSQEIEAGASSIIPIGAVAHMFGGSEKESLEIGTGEYNKKLDDKIAAIKQKCKIP